MTGLTLEEPQVLLEDGPLLAINKPAGMLTQGVPDGPVPTVEAWVKHWLQAKYQKPGRVYLGIPHRLDRPVSGVIVFARNSKAAARLAEQFRERTVDKRYWCVTEGIPAATSGRLEDWLLKDAEAAHVSVVAPETPGAKLAALTYTVQAVHGTRAVVEVVLETGRMHQIRVQMAHRGWPIVGDRQYGATTIYPGEASPSERAARIALHARSLTLKHPIRYDEIRVEADFPAEWQTLWTGAVSESTTAAEPRAPSTPL